MKIKLKQTEIGKIPEGWEVERIGNLVKINEETINRNYGESNIEYIDTSSVDKGHLIGTQKLKLREAQSRAKRIDKDKGLEASLRVTERASFSHRLKRKQ